MTSKSRAGLGALLRLYVDIALWRRGPQHVPAVGILLPLTLGAYVLINALLNVLLPAGTSAAAGAAHGAFDWLLQLCADIGFLLAWYWLLLRLFGRSARYRQTITAIFGFQLALAPPIAVAGWFVERYGSDTALQLPVYLVYLVMVVWSVLATAHILRATLERPMFVVFGLALLQLVAEGLLVYMLTGSGS